MGRIVEGFVQDDAGPRGDLANGGCRGTLDLQHSRLL